VGSCCINTKVRPQCESNDYYIYLASFGPILKVGISRARRFFERLVEQGADFGTKIASVRDGLIVRGYEQNIAKWLGIPDFVSGDTKAARLVADPKTSSMALLTALARLQESEFDFLSAPEIYDMRASYKLDGVSRPPELFDVKEGNVLKGCVAAAKGPVIVVKDRFRFVAVNAHRLIGREISALVSLEEFCEPA
jgi:hypothetical protein